ncbi:MAG: response regulator transcription factor [Motiliproteus sp.]|nr:response regulator transcription factor [Motiliproteus sp.]MCW9053822.1 response regulator transcription factor [Motiliproteus sp.]
MTSKKLIYVIEDEPDIATLVCRELENFGFETRTFDTGTQASRSIKHRQPDLCIVDLGLPDMDGMGLVRELCETHQIGVVILTGRGSLPDRVFGLEVGADDYIIKPFDPRELVARVKSVCRRLESQPSEIQVSSHSEAQFAGWSYTPSTLTLKSAEGETTELSSAESELLCVLLKSPKQVLSRDQLMGRLMGRESMPFDRSIDVRMSRIRKKLEADPKDPKIIKTVYGAGYMFVAEVSWSD